MRNARGFTLIELMICVAIIGISVVVVGNAVDHQRLQGLSELQRERATQLLEYHAENLSRGLAPAADVVRRLSEDLPQSEVTRTARAGATELEVAYRAPDGRRQALRLVVFTPGGR